MTIEKLLEEITKYNINGIPKIKAAYEYANDKHKGVYRQSGEPYITHPLTVAYILSEVEADTDTICACLLHDVIEDTEATKEEIAELFGYQVAKLVDGVTKISKLNFSNSEQEKLTNTRKIVTSVCDDIRIIIIKLADRLHNMRTLQYKNPTKQVENSIETLELFVPMAHQLGAYRIKTELEDLSFSYTDPEMYKRTKEQIKKEENMNKYYVQEMLWKINEILNATDAPHEVKVRTKNVYGVYKRLQTAHRLSEIHDLLAFKIMSQTIDECYLLLRPMHNLYKPVNSKFKDFICNPKTNGYQSIHTTVNGLDDKLIQLQLRTFEMDKIASFGMLHRLWHNTSNINLQEELTHKYQFYMSLLELNNSFHDNKEFVSQVKKELFAEKVYISDIKGNVYELPKGASVIDLAYKIFGAKGNNISGALVNDREVDILNYKLKDNDRVKIINNKNVRGPKEEWLDCVTTTHARKLILEALDRN